MKLLLTRHGETEHNVAGLLAGVTDSILTNHGISQTQRLGEYLSLNRDLHLTHIFASDLQRAYMTANAIRDAQAKKWPHETAPVIAKLELLREQDFGSLECTPWKSKRDDEVTLGPSNIDFVPKETTEAMTARAEAFLNDYLVPLLAFDAEEPGCVAVVSHGLFLSVLWRSLLVRFGPRSISLGPEVDVNVVGRPLEYLPGWANTGFLELDLACNVAEPHLLTEDSERPSKIFVGWKMVIRAVNGKDHLQNLKRTRGGLGSATFDAKQKNLDGFFKKPRIQPSGDA